MSSRSCALLALAQVLTCRLPQRLPTQALCGVLGRNYATSLFAAKDIHIPLERMEFNFARSSGPGGQNVNKVNTKAEIRFKVDEADWLPEDVRGRLLEYQSNKISKDGYLIISSQEHRTQANNKADCIKKLQEMVEDAYIEPKERQVWEGIGEKGKAKRREEKKRRGEVKANRRVDKRDWD